MKISDRGWQRWGLVAWLAGSALSPCLAQSDEPPTPLTEREDLEQHAEPAASDEASGADEEDIDVTAAEPLERTSSVNRGDSNFSIHYTPFSLGLFVGKKGPALSYIRDEDWTFELEYLKGDVSLEMFSINFASFEESLVLGKARWFPSTNSFNFVFGFGRRDYELSLGDSFFSRLAPEARAAHYNAISVNNYVVELGIANRWQWESGFTVGVDWLSLFIPVGGGEVSSPALDYIQNRKDRDNAGNVVSALRYVPTLLSLKVQLGWTF